MRNQPQRAAAASALDEALREPEQVALAAPKSYRV